MTCPCGYFFECQVWCGNGHQTGECREKAKAVKEIPLAGYRSPHKIPECTSPRDARSYPHMHSSDTSPKCPLHYETYGRSTEWARWYEARERYATAEDDGLRALAMESMLGYVTEDNPPVDAEKIRRRAPASKDQLVRAQLVRAQLRRARVMLVVSWVLLFPALVLTVAGAYPEGIVLNVAALVFSLVAVLASHEAGRMARS